MAKDANQFIFREEYEEWLRNLGIKSAGAYCPQDKYTCNDGREFLFFDLIGVFAKENDRLYVNALFEEWKAFIENKNQNNLKTTLNRFLFLPIYVHPYELLLQIHSLFRQVNTYHSTSQMQFEKMLRAAPAGSHLDIE